MKKLPKEFFEKERPHMKDEDWDEIIPYPSERYMKIMKSVFEHYEEACSLGHEVVGVFLQGSQNYLMDDEFSDVDTKCIILPSFNDIILGNKPVNYTHVRENNEHIDIKDVRLMFNSYKKQNINFVETLFTEYFVINKKYLEQMNKIREMKEQIAYYNVEAALNCMLGMIMEKDKALCHPYPNIVDKINKYGFDGKQLSHSVRVFNFMKNYTNGVSYKDCLTNFGYDNDFLVKLKRNEIYNLEEAKKLSEENVKNSKLYKDKYLEGHKHVILTELDDQFNGVISEMLKIFYKNEIY